MPKLIHFVPAAPSSKPQKATRTTADTILITPALVDGWKAPPFQRPLKINSKVRALGLVIASDGGVIPGVLTLGVMGKDKYLLDGQHRREAFKLSGCVEGYADVRTHFFDTMGDMGKEFVNLNSSLVRLKPDDILRGLEGSSKPLQLIRAKCPFVGYDMVRRGSHNAPMVSMSALVRCWFASEPEVPSTAGFGTAATQDQLTMEEAETLVVPVMSMYESWGRDPEYYRLWGNLNLTICFWIYRRTVVIGYGPKTIRLTTDAFKRCLMSLSASPQYLDWLVGRMLNDRDRSPCYGRTKALFVQRLIADGTARPHFPAPAWAHGGGSTQMRTRGIV